MQYHISESSNLGINMGLFSESASNLLEIIRFLSYICHLMKSLTVVLVVVVVAVVMPTQLRQQQEYRRYFIIIF